MKVQYFPYVLTLALISVNCLEYMKIPQVETGYIKAVQFNSNPMTKSGFQQVNFSQTFQTVFTETPQILLSVCLLELDANKISHMDFQISTQEINTLQFKGIIEKKNDLNIHELHISYLAINNKNVYVKSGSFKFNKKVQNKEKWIIEKQFFQYSRKDFQPWNVTISVYVTGINKSFDSSITQLWNYQYLSIFTNVTYSNDSFQIIFKTQDKNIEEVYFNYIEIYQQNDNNYYEILSVIDDSINASFQNDESKVESFVNDLFNQPNDYNQISDDLTSQKIRTIPQYKVQINNINGIFYGLTGLKAELSKNVRFKIQNPQIQQKQNLNYFFYEYAIWSDSQIKAAQSQFLVFSKINCSKNNTNFLDDQNSCVSDCPQGYFQQTIQDPIYGKQDYCLQCNPSCKACEKTADNCMPCNKKQFIYNNQCFSEKPNNTYIDHDNILKDCNYTTHPYLFQESCFAKQPDKTFCQPDQNKFNCKSCPDQCQLCDEQRNCLKCTQNFPYFYQNDCHATQPVATLCEQNQDQFNCKSCPIGCSTCNSQMICLTCLYEFPYLYDNQCYEIQPLRTFCNEKKICQDCYKNCLTCQGTTNQDCLSCNQQFYLFENQCICHDHSQFYDIQTDNCEFIQNTLISKSAKESLESTAESLDSFSVGMQLTFIITQFLTNSGSSLLSQVLTIQKIFYLQIVNFAHPDFLHMFIKNLSNGGVTKKFEQLNIFQNQIQVERQCYNETLDQKFEYNQLPSSIIQNSGGFMFVSICILIFQVILVILAKSPLNHYIYKIYDLFISSFLIQFSQMLALVFWYSFLLQVEYMSSNNSMIGFTSYAFLIVSLLSVLAIIYLHGISLYSIHQKKLITGQSMIFILQQKMLNGIITENLYTRIVICLGYSISNAYSLRFLNRIIGSKQFDLPKAHYNNLFSNYTINNLCYVDKPYFLNDLSMYSYCKLNQRHHKKEKF
ncbi:hypothetical protein ABPG73_022453 [Tetrahymena malaccensis]